MAKPQPGNRPRLTVRLRIVSTVVALTALALTSAGLVAFYVQRDRLDSRLDDQLTHSAAEFEQLVKSGHHPVTGAALSSPTDVISAAIQVTVPTTHQGILGLREGASALVSPQTLTVELERDKDFVALVTPYLSSSTALLTTIRTPVSSYRVLVFPVRGITEADVGQDAALVLAFDVDAEHQSFAEVFKIYAIYAFIAWVLTAVIAWVVAGRLLRPIRELATTAQRITDSDLSERVSVHNKDDLGAMAHSVNAMLDRLDRSFGAQRQLLDDVSHELRTPITIARGHLELVDVNDAADVQAARDVVLDELDRMNGLVSDLMTLASADSPDFVSLHITHVAALTREVFTKAQGLGPHTWDLAAVAEVQVYLDGSRITQAWLQLAANAVKYSAPDSTISLGSAVEDNTLRLWVQDRGKGIDAADHSRIFERFTQVSTSAQGRGLGLPIVHAIAEAHHGSIELVSQIDQGSTFTISIPLQRAHPGESA